MGGLSLLFMAGQQNAAKSGATNQSVVLPKEKVCGVLATVYIYNAWVEMA